MKLHDIIKQPEGRRLEFKEILPGASDLAKTIIAFANDAGGEIFIGVKDKPRMVVGIPAEDITELEERISNIVHDLCEPLIRPDISLVQADDKYLIRITIHKGSHTPYHLKTKSIEEGTFIRVGSTNRQATAEIIAELSRQRQNASFDGELGYTKDFAEIDISTFAGQYAEITGEPLTEKILSKLELIRLENGKMYASNALILLSDDEIRRQLFPFAIVECARFKGISPGNFIDQKTIDENIGLQADQAYQFVLRHISQGSTDYVGVYRTDRWEYPVIAIREAIRNAIIHRDYSLTGKDIKIAIFDDKIEITSPGCLLPSVDFDDMESGQSDIRNKILAPVFKKLGIIEKWGNGLRLIYEELQKYPEINFSWKEPGLSFRVVFQKMNYHKTGTSTQETDGTTEKTTKKTTKKTTIKTTMKTTIENREKILKLLQKDPGLSNKDLVDLVKDITIDGINYHLKKLREAGRIKHVGPRNGGRWEIL
jgi:ATP-dependent DNA helicase RecG